METKIKKVVATVALAGAITAGMAGAAFAADSPSTGTGTGKSDTTALAAHPRIRRAVRRGAVKVILDTCGGTRADLVSALKSGKTITDYCTANGKTQADIVNALVTAADARVDQLVANNRITPERAATIKGKVPDRVNKIVTRQFGQHA
jgi:hypothetical protein